MSELLFHGAAGEVTGSMHLVHHKGRWIALDCGLVQGRRAEAEEQNRDWPVPPKELAAVVLSHAHTDHTGRLPRLVRDGFTGPIYCTSATRDLCSIMLPDSAHIQSEDVPYVNKKRAREGLPPIEALYDAEDALAALRLMRPVPLGEWFTVLPRLRARFQEAGHMLGSTGITLALGEGATPAHTLHFTGDLGRPRTPILRDPAAIPPCDTLICESTYGGRVNPQITDAEEELARVVLRTIARGGLMIVPAFSVGRTQTIVYYLHRMMESGRMPRVPVFVDSPLAIDATEVFRLHVDLYDQEAAEFQRRLGDILGGRCCTFVREAEESRRLNTRREPCVIIAASGMCEAGRIRHHLKYHIEDSRTTILLPGYQAQNTLGRRLADGVRNIRLFHQTYHVEAEVVQLHGFSGHADQNELRAALRPLLSRNPRIFLVHGEREQSQALQERLTTDGFGHVSVAQRGQRERLE